jgi:hypothetical protein
VEFAGASGPATFVGGGPPVAAARGTREAEGSHGSEAVTRCVWQAGSIVRWPSASPGRQGRPTSPEARRWLGNVPVGRAGSPMAERCSFEAAGEWIGATSG